MAENQTSPEDVLAILEEAYAYFDARDLVPQSQEDEAPSYDLYGLAA